MSRRNSAPSREEAGKPSLTHFWLLVLLIGGVIIVFANTVLPARPVFMGVATALLSGLMVLFGYIANRNESASEDTKGDGIYYLGLLYTFAALAATLIKFVKLQSGTPDESEQNLDQLITNFGIALITTIVGLSGRVWFVMGREGPGDIAAGAKSALEDAVYRMKGEALRSSEAMESLVGHLEASENVWKRTVAKISGTADTVGDSCDRLVRVTRDLSDGVSRIQDAAAEIAHSASSLSKPMTDAAERLRQLTGDCDKFGGALAQAQRTLVTINGIHVVDGVTEFQGELTETIRLISHLRHVLEKTEKQFHEFSNQTERGSEALAGISSTGKQIGAISGDLADFSAGLNRLQTALKSIVKHSEDASQRVQSVATEISSTADPLRRAAASISDLPYDVARLRLNVGVLRSDISDSSQANKELQAKLKEAHESVPDAAQLGFRLRRALRQRWRRMANWLRRKD